MGKSMLHTFIQFIEAEIIMEINSFISFHVSSMEYLNETKTTFLIYFIYPPSCGLIKDGNLLGLMIML